MHATDGPLQAVHALISSYGAHARPLREVVVALTEQPRSLAALVHDTATPRRTVEEVLAAAGDDVVESRYGLAIRPERRDAYRALAGYDQLRRTTLADPLAARLAGLPELRAELADLVRRAPAARRALDHVAATPDTAARRGLWLDARYDLAGARLLCVGDHDLTSLAVGLVNREAAVTVVDLDERILEYVDAEAVRLGLDVRCLVADLRVGLPAAATGCADLVFTDPPYTPEGVALFLARGAEGLRDRERGRLVMAYGFSDRTPALGLKVQQAVQDLALVYEAILPGVQRYAGAEAIGSASDLYVCRPTARTWKLLDRAADGASHIYTHGPQSLEATGPAVEAEAVIATLGAPPTVVVSRDWSTGAIRLGLDRLLASGLPRAATVRGATVAAVDLAADPGPLLLQVLLAANADRVAALVPNDHPDLASEAGQRALAGLVAPKYRLRFLRSTPGPDWAVLVADRVPVPDGPSALVRRVLDRAHGKVGNVWRDGLVAAAGRPGVDGGMTRNEAREAVRAAVRRPDVLAGPLVGLPRHLLRELLTDIAGSAATPG